jgi:dienelactone hydrolase
MEEIYETCNWLGCKIEKMIVFDHEGYRVPCNLITPLAENAQLPVLICTHGATSSKHEWTELDGYTKGGNISREIVKSGIAVLAMDLHYHGDNDTANLNGKNVLLEENWDDFFNRSIEDIQFVIDYVIKSPRFDSTRIGFSGYSLAGTFGFYLANRGAPFKAMMLCVPGANRKKNTYYSTHNNLDNLRDIAVLQISAFNDEYVNFADAQWLFEQIPLTDKKFLSYPSGHSLPQDYVPNAVEWIVDKLAFFSSSK